jgi:hypothetical protein
LKKDERGQKGKAIRGGLRNQRDKRKGERQKRRKEEKKDKKEKRKTEGKKGGQRRKGGQRGWEAEDVVLTETGCKKP